jgi:hypothetical protein
MVANTESFPLDPLFSGAPAPAPPAPTVRVYDVLVNTSKPVAVLYPPAPPPPPQSYPPPPPPAITIYSTITGSAGAPPGAEAAAPKPKPPTPRAIPVKTGFSFLKNSLNIPISYPPHQLFKNLILPISPPV